MLYELRYIECANSVLATRIWNYKKILKWTELIKLTEIYQTLNVPFKSDFGIPHGAVLGPSLYIMNGNNFFLGSYPFGGW